MKTSLKPHLSICLFMLFILTIVTTSSHAQSWPTAADMADDMVIGWNLGNSLEVPDGETAWGNPATTQSLIDAINAAGFNTVRIPCAWDSYADQSTYEIDDTWLARVKEVVDYCKNNDMYVIINIHWDGGWLEENPFYSVQDAINEKQEAYWTQIANYFIDYDEYLLFAGTNEVHADYNTPTTEYIEVQESFNQTFVDAVRATGGNNTNRNLIVQTYNTNMWYGLEYFSMPTDVVNNHLFVETHYYDPYDFSLNSDLGSACTVWGQAWSDGDICTWGQEDYVEDLFARMQQSFTSQNIPVIIGEYGAIKRTSLSGTEYTDHIASREYYLEYITDAAIRYGMIPIYWDNGYSGDNGLALFDRSTGAVVDQGALDALMEGADVDTPDTGDEYTLSTTVSGSGSISLSPSGGSYDAGTVVTLTATAASGWQFSQWSGDISGTTNPVSVTINADMTVTATFTESETSDLCDNPTTISLPFSYDGSGEYCWITSGDISYINSWNTDGIEINGVDYTNSWSNSFPDKVDGYYYIHYTGSVAWAHFEAAAGSARKSAKIDDSESINGTVLYPNPFSQSITLKLEAPEQIKDIIIRDELGRQIQSLVPANDAFELELGSTLPAGMYYIQIISDNQNKTVSVIKK